MHRPARVGRPACAGRGPRGPTAVASAVGRPGRQRIPADEGRCGAAGDGTQAQQAPGARGEEPRARGHGRRSARRVRRANLAAELGLLYGRREVLRLVEPLHQPGIAPPRLLQTQRRTRTAPLRSTRPAARRRCRPRTRRRRGGDCARRRARFTRATTAAATAALCGSYPSLWIGFPSHQHTHPCTSNFEPCAAARMHANSINDSAPQQACRCSECGLTMPPSASTRARRTNQ